MDALIQCVNARRDKVRVALPLVEPALLRHHTHIKLGVRGGALAVGIDTKDGHENKMGRPIHLGRDPKTVCDLIVPSDERVVDLDIVDFKTGGGDGDFVRAFEQHIVCKGQGNVGIH